MKDKQTKRIEALARLQKHIAMLKRQHADKMTAVKNSSPVKATGRTLADAKVTLLAAQRVESLRYSLESVANSVARAEREALQIQAIISRGQ